jgi:hypothetical protein
VELNLHSSMCLNGVVHKKALGQLYLIIAQHTGGEHKHIQGFGGEDINDGDLEDLGVDGRILLK